MVARAMMSGVDKIASNNTLASLSQIELHEKAWRDIRNKLDSMLIGTNVLKGDAARKSCLAIDTLSAEDRHAHILSNWGPNYAERARPLLHQLQVLEKEINKLKSV